MPKPRKVVDFEQQYRALYEELLAAGGEEYIARVNRDFQEAARKQGAYGTSGSDDMVNEYILADHNEVRKLRNRERDLPQQVRGTADTLFSFMDELMDADNSLSSMNDYLAKFEDYYLEMKKDPFLSEEERQAAGERYERVTALRDQIQMQIPSYKHAKAYNTLMLSWLMGAGKDTMDAANQDEREKLWTEAMEEFGCSHNGLNVSESVRVLKEEVRASEISELSAVTVSVEAALPDLADAFVKAPADLTVAQKGFAVQNFDLAFHDGIISRDQKKALEKEGKDIFDLIYVNGKSMNEIYAGKYASSTYYNAVEQMKCDFMRDMLAGKQIDFLIPGEEMQILPVQAAVRANSGLSQEMEQHVRAVSEIDREGHHFAAEISASWQVLEQRSRRQIAEKRERMQENVPMYSNLLSVEPSEAYSFRLPPESERRRGSQFSIREHSGKMAIVTSDSEQTRREKETLIDEGEFIFNMMNNQMGVNHDHEIYAQAGITSVTELYYIDGKPAHEYVKGLYPGMQLNREETERLVKAEIVSAALSGRHYVEAAKVGMDEMGAFQVGVVQIQPDVRSLDGQERFYQTKPSKQMEKLLKEDKHREERQQGIRAGMSEKLVVASTKALKVRDARREPHAASYRRMTFNRVEMTNEYFDQASLNTLKAIPSDASMELPRGNFGGYRTYANLLLMARHPEVRFADLMNPDMYREEKLEVGREVAQAFSRLYAGPDPANPEDKSYLRPAAELMKTGMEVVAGLDVRKELLYALDEPYTADPERLKEIMRKPENLPMVNGFLRSMSAFSVNSFQALGRVVGLNDVSVARLDPEKADQYPPVYAELSGMVTKDLVSRYSTANSVTRAMNAERKWNELVDSYVRGTILPTQVNAAVASRIASDHIRNQIAEHEKITDISQPLELMEMGYGEFVERLAERVDKAAKAGTPGLSISHLMQGNLEPSLETQLVAEGKMALAIKEHGLEAAWREVTARNEHVMHGEAYFRNNDDRVFSDLGTASGLRTMERESSRSSVARIYMMGVMGASIDETIDPKNAEARLAAGDGLTAMMQNQQLREGMTAEELREVVRAYGDMYANAAQRAASEQLPKIDWKDPCEVAAVYDKLNAISLFTIDYSQTKAQLEKENGFVEAYGSKEHYREIDDQIDAGSHFLKAVQNVHGISGNTVSMIQRASGIYVLNACEDVFNGRALDTLTMQETEYVMQAVRDGIAIEVWATSAASGDLQKLQDYAEGKGPLPENAEAAVRNAREMHESLRAQRAAEAAQHQAEPVQQTEPVHQHEQTHTRIRVGLDDLMREEAATRRPRAQSLREMHSHEHRQVRLHERENERAQSQPHNERNSLK